VKKAPWRQLEILDDMTSDSILRDTILERGEITTFDLPHILPIKYFLNPERPELKVQFLWIDGDNSFDPYRIFQITDNYEIETEAILKGIQISRAFTYHQMFSLIVEKMWSAVRESGAKIVIVTGLPSLFAESKLREGEALKHLDAIQEKLEIFRNENKGLLLTAKLCNDPGNVIQSKLETIFDLILDVEKNRVRIQKGGESFDRSTFKINSGKHKTERTKVLEKFDGGTIS